MPGWARLSPLTQVSGWVMPLLAAGFSNKLLCGKCKMLRQAARYNACYFCRGSADSVLPPCAEQEKRITPIIVYPTQKTTSAALGSKMTLPCKVFAGPNSNIYTDVEWLANDTTIDVVYKQNRVLEGERQEITENGENFIEVPLIFKSVEEVDFYTDFKCLAQNRYGSQVLPTRVKQEAVGLPWYIAAIPVTLACVILVGICIQKRWKQRADKGYTIAKV